MKESEKKKKSFLRELLGMSASKIGGSPLKNDYQSLKRYLDEDKENNIGAFLSQKESSITN